MNVEITPGNKSRVTVRDVVVERDLPLRVTIYGEGLKPLIDATIKPEDAIQYENFDFTGLPPIRIIVLAPPQQHSPQQGVLL